MKDILLFDLKNCFNNMKFKIVSIIILLIPIIGFILDCRFCYGLNGIFIRSYSDMSFLNSLHMVSIKNWYIIIMPLVMFLLCSDIYSIEYNSGVYKNILTKISRKKYFISKIIIVFSITFVIVLFSLCFNYFLSYITYPSVAFDKPSGLPAFAIDKEFRSFGLFDMLRIQHRFIYDSIFILIFSLVAGLYSLLGLIVSFFIKDSKKAIIGTFALFTIFNQLILAIVGNGYSINDYLQGFTKGTYIFIIWIIIFIVIITIGALIKIRIHDEM